MKKILFDLFSAQPVKTSKFHGGGEYIKSIFYELVINQIGDNQLTVFYNTNIFLDEWIVDLIEEKKIRVLSIERLKEVETILINEDFDIFYTGLLANYENVSFPTKICKIGTIHGLRDLEKYSDKYAFLYEDNFISSAKLLIKYILDVPLKRKYIAKYENMLKKFDGIICVSKFTMSSIECNLFVNSDINIFYTPERYQSIETIYKKQEESDFILMVGGDRWIKNIYRAIKALDILIEKELLDAKIKVIIIGSISEKIKKKIRNKNVFEFKDYVTAEELEGLYSNCRLFVYPTLNEGFGMPPLEAMAYGKTCVVSGVASLPEICGDAVYYANPYDIQELANKIYQAYISPIDSRLIKKHYEFIKNKRDEDTVAAARYIVRNFSDA